MTSVKNNQTSNEVNKQLLEENKEKLLSEKERILGILTRIGKRDGTGEFPGEYKPNFPNVGDETDENASEVTQFETSLALTKNLEEKLGKIESALKRLEDGTYGKDKEGNDIPEERLRAVPEAEK
ncbi:MAG: hypothetical protein Q8P83_04100 [bacterium]|nr:hypothetical protein [bacterium]